MYWFKWDMAYLPVTNILKFKRKFPALKKQLNNPYTCAGNI